jgi:transcriptional regulator with PAS, ATPase and Fis domain
MKKTAEIEKVLIVGSDTDHVSRLSEFLMRIMHKKDDRLKVLYSEDEEKTLTQLKENPDIKLVLIDDSIKRNEFEHISSYIRKCPKIKILILSDQAGNTSEPKVVNKLDIDSIKTSIIAYLDDYDKLAKDSEILKTSSRQKIEYLMGRGKVISKVFDEVEMYAKVDKPILIEGATGTGKELIADYLYRLSARKNMITINCGTLSKELATNELFGSVKGAFTGAQNMKGKVEAVNGGILFLDEFNSLPLDIQVNLLRLMENHTFIRVGDTVERAANIRIIAAANKSCRELVVKGELRQDLYERFINTIYVPTLNERIEDIDYFIDRFISEENKTQDKTVSISNEARKLLAGHEWLGNIRQLKNVITKLVIEVKADSYSREYIIQPQLIRECFNKPQYNTTVNVSEDDYTLQTAYKITAEKAIRRALDKTKGNNEKAIKLLGISHGTYFNLKKKLGL